MYESMSDSDLCELRKKKQYLISTLNSKQMAAKIL